MSMTATVAQYILDALAARIKNLSVFTAFDVTSDARDLTDENVSHRDVRNIVHQEFQTGQFPPEYNQDSIELVVANNPLAIVYYPDGKSAYDHPLALQPSTPAAPPVPVTSVGSSIATPSIAKQGGHTKDGDGYICSVTADGRINLPQTLLSKVQDNGGTYDVAYNGGVLYKKPHSDGRIRVGKTELGGGSKFRVSVDTTANTIVVEQI